MTIQMVSWALDQDLRPLAKLALTVMALKAGENGKGKITVDELLRHTGDLSQDTLIHLFDKHLHNHAMAAVMLDGTINYEIELPQEGGESNAPFLHFYSAYPRHVGRGAAERAYRQALKKADHLEIMAGLTRAMAEWKSRQTEKQYIPHPATWLNGERWRDETNIKRSTTDENYVNSVLR